MADRFYTPQPLALGDVTLDGPEAHHLSAVRRFEPGDRVTGRALWQSDLVEASSNLKDTWFFGTGPYRRGSIQRDAEFAGESLPRIPAALHVFPDEAAPKATEIRPESARPARELLEVPGVPAFGSTLFGGERHWFGSTRPTVATRPEAAAPRALPAEIVGPPWPAPPIPQRP